MTLDSTTEQDHTTDALTDAKQQKLDWNAFT